MEFDITELKKSLLIQALFAHAAPLGLGKAEYNVRKKWGENVIGLTDEECDILLHEFNTSFSFSENYHILDYYKGKPMKLNFYRNKNGRVIVDSGSYDVRNGKYRFLEAMLNTFSMDEILIIKKGYRPFVMSDLPNHLIRPKEQEAIFKKLLKNTIQKENRFGKYWALNETRVSYKPTFMDF